MIETKYQGRALYHSLRMHFESDPSMNVEPWQVADYRAVETDHLFEQLKQFDYDFDTENFIAHADESDSPEDFTLELMGDAPLTPEGRDYLYLIVFELWRRFLPERVTLSVFCDELDTQIEAFNKGKLENISDLTHTLSCLHQLLVDETDQGKESVEAAETIQPYLASNLERFLYDFVLECFEQGEENYAHELFEDFLRFIPSPTWFLLLGAHLEVHDHPEDTLKIIESLLTSSKTNQNLELVFEIFVFLIQDGDEKTLSLAFKKLIPLLKTEGDVRELLELMIEYVHCLDREDEEAKFVEILNDRPEDLTLEIDNSFRKELQNLI